MEQGQEARGLAVLLGCEDMRQIFEAWPPRMNLAVCLREDGHCSLVVFRDEEASRILPRLRRTMGLSMSEITVFPKTDGFPTRKLLFSEETRLTSLVRNSPEIVEEATDYSINYTYAVDEGMDPVMFIHSVRNKDNARRRAHSTNSRERVEEKARRPVTEQATDRTQALDRPRKSNDLPKFLQRGVAVSIGAEPSPKCSTKISRICQIDENEQGWFRIDLPGSAGGRLVEKSLGRIFLRDDGRVIAIQKDKELSMPRDMPRQILVYVGDRWSPVREALARNTGLAQVTSEQGFLFIDLKDASGDRAHTQQSNATTEPTVPYGKTLLSSGVVIIGFLLIFQSFFPSISPDVPDQEINWSQFQMERSNGDVVRNFGSVDSVPFDS